MSGRALGMLAVVGCGLFAAGCGRPPAVQFHNLKLISSLRTAISAQNANWLDGVHKAVAARRQEGEMSDDEYEHFQSIIAIARDGRWKEAEAASFRFEESQLNRRRAPPRESDDHHHEAPAGKT